MAFHQNRRLWRTVILCSLSMAALVPSAAPWPIVVDSTFSATWPMVLSSSPAMIEVKIGDDGIGQSFEYEVRGSITWCTRWLRVDRMRQMESTLGLYVCSLCSVDVQIGWSSLGNLVIIAAAQQSDEPHDRQRPRSGKSCKLCGEMQVDSSPPHGTMPRVEVSRDG